MATIKKQIIDFIEDQQSHEVRNETILEKIPNLVEYLTDQAISQRIKGNNMNDKKEVLNLLTDDIPATVKDIETIVKQLNNIINKLNLIYNLSHKE